MEDKPERKALELFIKNIPQALWRTDLFSLAMCELSIDRNDNGEKLDVEDAKDLFWNFFSPKLMFPKDEMSKDTPVLSEDEALVMFKDLTDFPADELELVLEKLEKLEIATRVPYEPDVEENYDKLLIYLHVAACRAFALKKRDGYSEDVRQLLEESWHAWGRFIGGEWLPFDVVDMRENENKWMRFSVATAALVLVELFRVHSIEGDYEKALNLFALALAYASDALFAAFKEGEDIEYWKLKFTSYVPIIEVDAQKATDVFENLRASHKKKDWRQIAADCRMIIRCWGDCIGSNKEFRNPEEKVTDRDGQEWTWLSFWEHARGYAEAKLEPSELLGEMERVEDERAQQRLKVYFFDNDAWSLLTDRAKRSLIEAERVYFSAKVGRIEAVLNELRISTDEILYSNFWLPLTQWSNKMTNPQLLDFLKLRQELDENEYEPSLSEFKKMLKTYAFKEFINTASLPKEDKDFILYKLPGSLEKLMPARRRAEHGIGRIGDRKDIEPLFREFLGIGCDGILPRMLEIRKKIPNSRVKMDKG